MNGQDKRVITVYDIAKEAGVSVSTVSRVLTGSARVKEDKRILVEELISKYNFKPNSIARSLYNKQSRMLGFILPDITHPFFAAVFLEAEKRALELGYSMVMCNSMNDEKNESEYLQILLEKQVDGIIFMGGRVNNNRVSKNHLDEMIETANKVPLVLINGSMRSLDCYRVYADEADGILKLVSYLVEQGHDRIGLIGGINGISSTDIKVKAFTHALKKLNLKCNNEWIIPGSFTIESGENSIRELLKNKNLPTAVLCINDYVAIGAIHALQENAFNVPKDMSVAGFDDIYLTDIIRPRLTSVSQNYFELGRKAIEVLSGALNGVKQRKITIVKTELIARESCSKLS